MSARPRLRLVDESAPAPAGPSQGAGERAADEFADMFRKHYGLVHRMLREFGVPEAELDDAAQAVFLIVHRRWADYDGRTPFTKWLLGIVRRVAMNHVRSVRRAHARLDRVEAPQPTSDPQSDLEAEQRAGLFAELLADLDADRRQVLLLADVEGLTAPEIAGALGIKLNTVYSRLRIARQRLQDAWARRGRGGQDV